MADLNQFARRIRSAGKRVEANADAMVRKVALAVDATVVIATPVDTGRARSNWQVNLGYPAGGTREAYSAGKDGSTAGPNAQAALDQGRATISQYTGGGSVHITNNLPYIGKLNEGSSAQAPAGFVEEAVLAGVAAVRSFPGLTTTVVKEGG